MDSEISIIFLRHGRSRADDENVHEGRYDSPLTETGRAQAHARAEQLRADGLRADRIITSPLRRARETAEIIGAALGAPVETDPDWLEVDNGPLAGLPFEVAAERYPPPAFRNPYEPMCAGEGESDWDLHIRAARAVQNVIRRGPGQYLVVAHGGVLNAALRGIVGAGPAVNLRQGIWFAFGDTGYARAVYRPEYHQWILRELRSA